METKKINELRELDRSRVNHLLTDRLGEGTQMSAYSAAYIISSFRKHPFTSSKTGSYPNRSVSISFKDIENRKIS